MFARSTNQRAEPVGIKSTGDSIHKIFSNQRKTIRENLFLVVTSLMRCKSCQTPPIIQEMGKTQRQQL